MDPVLDPNPQLVALLIALNGFAISAAILLAAHGYPRTISQSMQIFSYGKVMVALAFALVAARGFTLGPTIVLADGLGVAGFYTNYVAARILQGKAHGLGLPTAIVGLVLAGTSYFAFVPHDLMGVRVVVSSALVAILGMLVFELLVRYRLPGSAHVIAGVAALAVGIALLARLALSLKGMGQPIPDDSAGWVEKGFLLLVYVAATMGTVAFVLMCNDAFNGELRHLAATDPLSGLANRRRLFERGAEEVNRAHRFGHPLSVLVADIDHFKRINDTWGHATGDHVIHEFARIMAATVRDVDVVGRLGGEEFAVVLPETDQDTAAEVAERLRQAASASAVVLESGEPVRITASIGMAAWNAGASFQDVLNRADAAMYKAKMAGRNRVAVTPRGGSPLALNVSAS